MTLRFGTDGVRGIANEELTPELTVALGRSAARRLGASRFLIGRDTRRSGPLLEAALAAGLASEGASVELLGVLPTPGVAWWSAAEGVPSAVISASHNPPQYNGVKFFDADGFKLPDAAEAEIEALLETPPSEPAEELDARWPEPEETLRDRYVDVVTARFRAPLDGLRVACDCANGAMSGLAPAAFERLGASVTAVGDDPDGTNINVGCGATDLSLLTSVVRAGSFDLGVAFDGDGDRMLAVDQGGTAVDGDQILAVLALLLGVDLVVVTTMTNLGFHRLMVERGIRVVTTDVGDRYVVEALRREGGVLGGEQSGHVVVLDGHTTGDGLVAALLLARALAESNVLLSELVSVMPRYPQSRASVSVRSKELTPRLLEEVERANAKLGGRGRVVVRPSGTEPVVRVLAEAETEEVADDLCASIGALARRELG